MTTTLRRASRITQCFALLVFALVISLALVTAPAADAKGGGNGNGNGNAVASADAKPDKPAQAAKPKPAEASKPKPAQSSKPKPAEASKPKPAQSSKPKPAQAAKPKPAQAAKPKPAQASKPKPAQASKPKPAQASKPKPAQASKPKPSQASKPAKVTSQSANGATQGASPSDPDGDSNGGLDKPGGSGSISDDRDGNNGCGNDDDREDDNNGNCGGPGKVPAAGAPTTPDASTPQAPAGGDTTCSKSLLHVVLGWLGIDVGPDCTAGSSDAPAATASDAGKVTICHATGSATNPFVEITINENGLNGHGDHEGDIIPAPAGGCPTLTVPETPEVDVPAADAQAPARVTICHATGSATNPFVEITINENGLNGHGDHEGDIIPAPAGGCPTVSSAGDGGTEAQPADGTTTPPADATTSPADETTTPPAGDTTTPPGGDTTTPTAGDATTGTSGGDTTPDATAGQDDAGSTPQATEGAADAGGDTVAGAADTPRDATAGAADTPEDAEAAAGVAAEGDDPALPFTGLALGLLLAMGVVATGAGLAARRAARRSTAGSGT